MLPDSKYTIYAQAPDDEDGHPGMTIELDLRSLLSILKDGWQDIFEKKYGRPLILEKI